MPICQRRSTEHDRPQLLASPPASARPSTSISARLRALANVALLNRVPVIPRDPYETAALLNNWLQAIGNGGAFGPDGEWIEYRPANPLREAAGVVAAADAVVRRHERTEWNVLTIRRHATPRTRSPK